MRAPTDLHPDDHTARVELRDLLVQRRRDLHLSQAALATRIGVAQSAVAQFETRQPWRINATRRIAWGLDMRVVTFPDGIPGGPYDDQDIQLFRPADPVRADVWEQKNLMSAMVAARRACGVTQAELATRLGVTENALGNFERTRTGLMFATCQRYCRALGGYLWLGVETVATVEAVAA